MQVKSFMLTSGHELIAQLVEVTGRGYKIKKPLVAHMMRTQDGVQVAFARWSMLHTEEAVIELLTSGGLVADPVDVVSEIEASYLSNVSGILVPPTAPAGRILQG
jgi:hypothetical protein